MDNPQSTGSFQASNRWLMAAGASGALAVALGAFGAHALEGALSPERAYTYATASQYHFIHVLALLACALLVRQVGLPPKPVLRYAATGFGIGQLLFCGSLYILATRGLIGLEGAGWLGAITPLGGVAFIVGWVCLGLAARGPSD